MKKPVKGSPVKKDASKMAPPFMKKTAKGKGKDSKKPC
jgi:hypothetical protein